MRVQSSTIRMWGVVFSVDMARFSRSIAVRGRFSGAGTSETRDEGCHQDAQQGAAHHVTREMVVRAQQADRDRRPQAHRQNPVSGAVDPQHRRDGRRHGGVADGKAP